MPFVLRVVSTLAVRILSMCLGALAFSLCSSAFGEVQNLSASATADGKAQLSAVSEPPEFKGLPARQRIPPTSADALLANSKVLSKVDPAHPETLSPALRDVDNAIKLEP